MSNIADSIADSIAAAYEGGFRTGVNQVFDEIVKYEETDCDGCTDIDCTQCILNHLRDEFKEELNNEIS